MTSFYHIFMETCHWNLSIKESLESSGEQKTAAENDLKLLNDVLASTMKIMNSFIGVLPVDWTLMKILGQQDCSIA